MEGMELMENGRTMLARAYVMAAKESPDLSTQNGAIIVDQNGSLVIGMGVNKLPAGVAVSEKRLQRPDKYLFTEHAERNAIFSAAYNGRRCRNATMFACWAACADCARAIINSGITTLVRHDDATRRATMPGKDWTETINVADVMLMEAGVQILEVIGKVCGDETTIRFSGETWSP